jgi:hypothetical protein
LDHTDPDCPRIRLLEARPENDLDNRSTSTSTPQPKESTPPATKKKESDEEESEVDGPAVEDTVDMVSEGERELGLSWGGGWWN